MDDQTLANLTVRAGELSRNRTIVSFSYPAGGQRPLALRDAGGLEHPVQLDPTGVAHFILPSLAARQTATFALVPASEPPRTAATAAAVDEVVRLGLDDRPVVDFQIASRPPPGVLAVCARGGYLHPLYTPAGVVVSGDYPEDHRHHHGVWTAWTRASFNGRSVDFWNVQAHEGRVDLDELVNTWRGPVHAGLEARLSHVALLGEKATALTEHWRVRVYKTHEGPAPYNVIELESTQEAATAAPLQLLQYAYGGLALRGHDAWRDPADTTLLTSEGRDRLAGDHEASRWCFIGGAVQGRLVGCAALGHPSNFRAPQKLRIHPTDPYVAFAPVQDGPFTIEPGTPYVTRFRFVTTDGPPDAALLDHLWADYAAPPEVTVTPVEHGPRS